MPGKIREFTTGATRDSEEGKFDYEGFFCPLCIEEFGKYMNKHRKQQDGNLRDSDNWQKGMHKKVYIKSLWRHAHTAWKIHRGYAAYDDRDGHEVSMEESLCGVIFNAFGYMHEILKKNYKKTRSKK